jgi:hypothetical protein
MCLAFLICTEPAFEKKSILLARSIRRFAGRFRDAPIYSFCPRSRQILSDQTLAQFSTLGIINDGRILNTHYGEFGVNNKPFVCAHAEKVVNADILVFLDSDIVFFNEPSALLIPRDTIAAVKPVDIVNIGVKALHGGQNEEYWRFLFEICGVKNPTFLQTIVDEIEIMQYFNSAIIATRPEDQLFSKWASNFEQVMSQNVTPTDSSFIEQSVFSATLSGAKKHISMLPTGYNYPIASHHRLGQRKRIRSFDEVISIHYHRMFDYKNWLPFLTNLPLIDRSSQSYDWLIENLQDLDNQTIQI